MKKIIIIMLSVLLALYILLSVGTSGNEYAAERLFYRAMKMNGKISANPDVAPPRLLAYVENNLKTLLAKYPKTAVARTAGVTLAEFYIANKRYEDALSRVDLMIKAYDKDPAVLSAAYFLKGRAYEKQDKWPAALKEYKKLQDDYTSTELGMQIPLYIAKYYADKGRDADARQAYSEAAAFYKKLEKDNSGKGLGYISNMLLLQSYLSVKNYEESGNVIEETINKYRSGETLRQLLPQVENIIVKELKRPEKAIEIYNNIKANTKEEKLIKFLDKEIELLQKGKE